MVIILISSCKKECPQGYSGSNCDIATNQKYTGLWSFFETCTPSGVADPGTLSITKDDSNPYKFNMIGLWTFGFTPTICDIHVDNENEFSATRQPLYTTWDVEVTSGRISNTLDTLFLNYNIYATGSNSIADQCNSIAIKN